MEKSFVCDESGNVVVSHEKTSAKEKPFECNHCGCKFTSKSNLTSHIQRVHEGQRNYNCDQCDMAFFRYAEFQRHRRTHTGKPAPFKCEFCGRSFRQSLHLQAHQMLFHTGETRFACEQCDYKCIRGSQLRQHVKTKHRTSEIYKCDQCGCTCTTKEHLRLHVQRVHDKLRTYQCDMCSKRFFANSGLLRHRRIHTGEKPFECEICTRAFTQKTSLQAHKRVHTGERPFECEVCGMAFTQPSSLKNHKRTHTGERPFKCEFCDMTFSQKNSLLYHKRIHTGEKPYSCGKCDFRCSVNKGLKRHVERMHGAQQPAQELQQTTSDRLMNTLLNANEAFQFQLQVGDGPPDVANLHGTHTGENPLECGLGAHKKANLKDHIDSTYATKRNYRCDVCFKQFFLKFSRDRHRQSTHSHIGERPFPCQICGATFLRKCSLKIHKRRHFGEKPFACDHCNCRFNQELLLLKHVLAKHHDAQQFGPEIEQPTPDDLNEHKIQVDGEKCDLQTTSTSPDPIAQQHSSDRKFVCSMCCATFKTYDQFREHAGIHRTNS